MRVTSVDQLKEAIDAYGTDRVSRLLQGEYLLTKQESSNILYDAVCCRNLKIVQLLVGSRRIDSQSLGIALESAVNHKNPSIEIIQAIIDGGEIDLEYFGSALYSAVNRDNPNMGVIRTLIGSKYLTSKDLKETLGSYIYLSNPRARIIGTLAANIYLPSQDFKDTLQSICEHHPTKSIEILTEISRNVQDPEKAALVAIAAKQVLVLPLKMKLTKYIENQERAKEIVQVLTNKFLRRYAVEFDEVLPARAERQNTRLLPNIPQIANDEQKRTTRRRSQSAPVRSGSTVSKLADALRNLQKATEQGITAKKAHTGSVTKSCRLHRF